MYRRKILYLAALVVSLILAVTGCSPKKTENMPGSEGAAHCEIYYIDNINQTLKFEMMAVDGKSQEEQVFDAYKKMRDVQKTPEIRPFRTFFPVSLFRKLFICSPTR